MYVWGVGTNSFWKLNRTGVLLLGSGATALGGLAMEQAVQQSRCGAKTEVYSRVCGFFRPVQQWNRGKREEYSQRREFVVEQEIREAGRGVE